MVFTFMYDIYGSFRKIDMSQLTADQEQILLSRGKSWAGVLGLSSIFVVFVGLSKASLYDLIVSSFSIQIVLFWPIIGALLFPNRDLTRMRMLALFGLWAGLLVAVVMIGMYISGNAPLLVLNMSPIAAFFVTFIVYVAVVFLAPKKV